MYGMMIPSSDHLKSRKSLQIISSMRSCPFVCEEGYKKEWRKWEKLDFSHGNLCLMAQNCQTMNK